MNNNENPKHFKMRPENYENHENPIISFDNHEKK